MKIIISPRAEKQLKKITKIDQIALARKIRLLGKSSQTLDEEKLAGFRNIYRIRVGSYRIVYKKTAKLVYVVLIGHRREIYQLLKRALK